MQTTAPPIPTPRKSRRRWYAIAGFLALCLATPYAVMLISEWQRDRELEQIYAELDAEDPNWRWADLIANQPKPPPDERNAAVQVAKVAKFGGNKVQVATMWGDAAKYTNTRLSEGYVEALRAAFKQSNPKSLEEARKLMDMREGCLLMPANEIPWEGVGTLFLDFVGVMRLLQYDACLRTTERDIEGAAESCQAILHTARAIDDCPVLMSQLVRFAGQQTALESIERTLGQGEISEPRLRALQSALTIEAEHNGLYHALRGERAGLHQYYLLERAGKIPPFRNPRNPVDMKERILEVFPSLVMRGYPDVLRNQSGMVRASQLPEQAQPQAFQALEDQVQKKHENGGILGSTWDDRFIFGIFQQHQLEKVRLRCAIVAIAAERYRLQHQAWPSGIDDLVTTGILKEPYTDPYDGHPLRWKKTAVNLIIYCVGPTKLDDGGKLNTYGARPDGLGFVLWVSSMRGLPPPTVQKAR
jgi:hypothetical protein